MLFGRLSTEELYRRRPDWGEIGERYTPRRESVEILAAVEREVDIKVFLGSWCPDSREHIPGFLKVYERVDNPRFHLEMIAVDQEKKDSLGLAERYGVEKVPTIVFLSEGKELGRIIETPKKRLEEDFAAIVTGRE